MENTGTLTAVTAHHSLRQGSRLPRQAGATHPTGFAPLDRALDGGLPEAGLVEVVAPRGGLSSFMHRLAATRTRAGEDAAWLDPGCCLDIAGLEAAGTDLARLLWIPAGQVRALPALVDMLLGSGIVPLILLDLAHAPRASDVPQGLPAWIRLARRAESHRVLLVTGTRQPTAGAAAHTTLLLDPPRPCWQGQGRTPRTLEGADLGMHVTRRRHGQASGRPDHVHLDLDT
jgi:hypothetical protein